MNSHRNRLFKNQSAKTDISCWSIWSRDVMVQNYYIAEQNNVYPKDFSIKNHEEIYQNYKVSMQLYIVRNNYRTLPHNSKYDK